MNDKIDVMVSLAGIVEKMQTRAHAWRLQAATCVTEQSQRECEGKAAAIEQLAHDLEDEERDEFNHYFAQYETLELEKGRPRYDS